VIGTRIRALREELGLTQAELSERLGINANTLAGYERGTREPNYEKTCIFSKYFNVSADYLLGLTDYKHNEDAKRLSDLMEELIGQLKGELPGTQEQLVSIFDSIYALYEDASMAEFPKIDSSLGILDGIINSLANCFNMTRLIYESVEYDGSHESLFDTIEEIDATFNQARKTATQDIVMLLDNAREYVWHILRHHLWNDGPDIKPEEIQVNLEDVLNDVD
jgi:transcriptional regulator with XRE-family HTH domain